MRFTNTRFSNWEAREAASQETVYRNGREIRISRFNKRDKLATKLGFSPEEKLALCFALCPTRTVNGLVWLQFYYSYQTQRYGGGLYADWTWCTRWRAASLKEFEQEYSRFVVRQYHERVKRERGRL